MNGYELMAESWKMDLNELDEENKVHALKKIKVYEFLATCDTDDLCNLVDSSALNDFIKAYIEYFVTSCSIDEQAKEVALNELHAFDLKEAKTILKAYKGG